MSSMMARVLLKAMKLLVTVMPLLLVVVVAMASMFRLRNEGAPGAWVRAWLVCRRWMTVI
jgi:hypothetical protein